MTLNWFSLELHKYKNFTHSASYLRMYTHSWAEKLNGGFALALATHMTEDYVVYYFTSACIFLSISTTRNCEFTKGLNYYKIYFAYHVRLLSSAIANQKKISQNTPMLRHNFIINFTQLCTATFVLTICFHSTIGSIT